MSANYKHRGEPLAGYSPPPHEHRWFYMCCDCGVEYAGDAIEDAPRTLRELELIEAIEECSMLLAEVHLAFPHVRHGESTFGQLAQMYEATAKGARAALAAARRRTSENR